MNIINKWCKAGVFGLIGVILFLSAFSYQSDISYKKIQTGDWKEDFNVYDSSLWKSGYIWGTTDSNMGNTNSSNIAVNNGSICLSSPGVNNTGGITSTKTFGYGTFETRMKFTASNGTWPAFWVYNDNNLELDVIESLGNHPDYYYTTNHVNGAISQKKYTNSSSLENEWHIYKLLWDSTHVEYYFDGIMYYSFPVSSTVNNMQVTLNMGIMGNGSVIWDGNKYDATTWSNGNPNLCVDYFSYSPLIPQNNTTTPTVTITPSSTPTLALTKTVINTITPTPSITKTVTPTVTLTPISTQSSPIFVKVIWSKGLNIRPSCTTFNMAYLGQNFSQNSIVPVESVITMNNGDVWGKINPWMCFAMVLKSAGNPDKIYAVLY